MIKYRKEGAVHTIEASEHLKEKGIETVVCIDKSEIELVKDIINTGEKGHAIFKDASGKETIAIRMGKQCFFFPAEPIDDLKRELEKWAKYC